MTSKDNMVGFRAEGFNFEEFKCGELNKEH
jgi:hypothetical protein